MARRLDNHISMRDEQIKQGKALLRSLKATYPYRYGKAVLLWTGDTETPYQGWTLFTTRQGAIAGAKRRQMTTAHYID